MPEFEDPVAVRWLVGVALTNFRESAGRTITAAAKHLGCSPGKVGHLESGRNHQQPAEVRSLLEFYGADEDDIERLESLAGQAAQQTWLAEWTDVVPDWLRTFVGLEGLASRSLEYAPLVVPALLQTEGYASGVTAGNIRVRPDHSERMVRLRMRRQGRLTSGQRPLAVTALLEEAVLRRPVGGAEVLRGQLRHLLELGEREHIEIRILPISVGSHDGLVGPFTVLEFPTAQPIGYVELVNGAVLIQDQEQVRGYTRAVSAMSVASLSRQQSHELMLDTLRRMQSNSG